MNVLNDSGGLSNFFFFQDVIKYWLRKGIDGFRVDAIPHLFENSNFPDEPRSYAPGATERDYTYLDHIYTKDDQRTYDMVASWRKVLDDYADHHNEDEKVSTLYFSSTCIVKFFI